MRKYQLQSPADVLRGALILAVLSIIALAVIALMSAAMAAFACVFIPYAIYLNISEYIKLRRATNVRR